MSEQLFDRRGKLQNNEKNLFTLLQLVASQGWSQRQARDVPLTATGYGCPMKIRS